ncbi:hypothetical protein DPMN_102345 [Dreissena polymorpha]|uniref:Uncharacterized protein n=1 Tax=Dreissena polymorpha TaxID=45954 RepID=A0A9D4R9T3_DREPO|nr:hypothetical protein DPMN_102345 [Dreissena polymorpha]
MHRSLPGDDTGTGQNLTGPFIGNDQLTGPVKSLVNIDRSSHWSCYDRCRHRSLSGHRSCYDLSPVIDRSGHRSCYDRSGHRLLTSPGLTGPVTGHVMTGLVTGNLSVPQTVPVTVDVDTTLSVLHKGRRSRVSTVSHRRKRVLSDVSGYSFTSGWSSYDSSSTSTSPHHYRSGRLSRSQSVSRRRFPRKERSCQRSGRRSIRKHHSQRRRTVSRHRRDKGHRPSSIRRSRTHRSPRRSFSEESSDTLPHVSASILASTHTSAVPTTTGHNLYSNTSSYTYQAPVTGVNLTTSAAFSAPRVFSTLHRSIPRAAATPSNPNTLWIQQSPGIFVPFTTDPLPATAGIQSVSADLITDRPN